MYSTLACVQCGGKEAEQDGWEDVAVDEHLGQHCRLYHRGVDLHGHLLKEQSSNC